MFNIRQADIAKELNVSRVTVSKALRNHPDISREMKRKIEATAARMGYVPNLIARQLNTKKTHTLGINVPDLENSFFSYIVDSMIDYATEHDFYVILTVSREKEDIEKQNIKNLIGMRVEGLLVCLSQETIDREIFRTVEKMKIPLVFFDRTFDNLKFSTVTFDDKTGALNGLNNIIKEGYTRIAHFAGYSTTNIGKTRIEGYTQALKENKIPIREEWIIEGGFELKDGYESFKKLKSAGPLPEIIFTVNDRVALGVYNAAKETGLRIPEDIGIVGYGFNETTDFFDPPLTVINQDPRKIAVEAITLLINEIENPDKKIRKRSKLSIDEEFIWRNSVKRMP